MPFIARTFGLPHLHVHLLLPLLSSMLFAMAMVLAKRATSVGATTWMVVIVANGWAGLLFSFLWFYDPAPIRWELLWQPVLIGGLYILGQSCTFLALARGDVTVATPILCSKIVVVACLAGLLANEPPSAEVWLAVFMAMFGIMMVQMPEKASAKGNLVLAIFFALSAALTFALFDILVQIWAPAWGRGQFLAIAFWVGALLATGYLPLVPREKWKQRQILRPLLVGTLCMGLQALCIVSTLAYFGDAAKVNVVYALRGLFGLIFAWAFAKRFNMAEQHLPRSILMYRCIGTVLLTGAVVAILLERPVN